MHGPADLHGTPPQEGHPPALAVLSHRAGHTGPVQEYVAASAKDKAPVSPLADLQDMPLRS